MRRFIIILVSLLSVVPLLADALYSFQSLTTADGLSSSCVRCMHIDSKGFMWIGTDMGLDRYDGYQVESMGGLLGEKWQFSTIDDLQEDAMGNLWIDCQRANLIYNVNTHITVTDVREWLKTLKIDVGEDVYKVKVDDSGSLWVVQQEKITHYDYNIGLSKSWEIPQLAIDDINLYASTAAADVLLLAGRKKVLQFSATNGKLEQLDLPADMRREDNIYGSFIDSDRSIWVFSIIDEKICRYTMGGKTVKEMITLPQSDTFNSRNNAIRDMMDDGRGNVWIATDHKGIFVYHKPTGEMTQITSLPNGHSQLSSNNVISLTIDKQGTVWAGHFQTGISYTSANSRMFQNKGIQYGNVSALFCDSKGRRWIGTDGGGLYLEHEDGTYEKTTLPSIIVSSITEDDNGTIWVGSYSEGLFRQLPGGRWEQFGLANGRFPTNNVWKMINDGKGHIWCASAVSPLVKINANTCQWEVVNDERDYNILGTDFCIDARGNLLVSSTYGLVIINEGKSQRLITNFRGTQEMVPRMAESICYDSNNDLLLLGHRQGITIFDMNRDTLYMVSNQVNGREIDVQDIVQDKRNVFWVSTTNGITRLKVNRKKDGCIEWEIKNYTAREGLQTPFFNANSSALTNDGHVLLGGFEGYTVINPDETGLVTDNPGAPVIISVMAGDRYIDANDGRIVLNHDDTHLTIRYFTGILNNASSVRYAYKLEGMMNQWRYTEENHITLVGLAPGDYKLLLRLSEDNNQVCQLSIHVKSPFYLTGWAFMVYALMACVAGYVLWRRTRRRQLRELRLQKEDMERQKQAQITEMKLQFFTNISHDLRTPLTLIISPIDMIVKKLENGQMPASLLPQLKNIRKNAQLLLNQVGSLLDFRRLDVGVERLNPSISDIVAQLGSICLSFEDYSKERRIPLDFECKEKSFMMKYDKEKMSKILYNLLSNAFKFTEEGESIRVGFWHDQQQAFIVVADTGRGIPDADKSGVFNRFYKSGANDPSQTGSGIGLHIVKEYVGLHGGQVSVTDNTPKGSVFTISIPIVMQLENAQANSLVTSSCDEDASQRPLVLVVDDNREMLNFISDSLLENYRVLQAENGQQALDLLASQDVALVVSDVMMPGIDGFELCRRIKSDINTSHIPVILLTARTTDESKVKGLQLGADDYLTKPFNMDVLRLRVQKLMEWAESSHQEFKKKVDISPSEITITPLDEQFIQKAIKTVEERISDSDFSVEELGKELGMSRSFLYKKLMAITGVGPAEFIRTIRVKRGMALLERSQMQISEIAYQVGFNSLKSFTMNFKAEYGMTPSEYLKNRKNE